MAMEAAVDFGELTLGGEEADHPLQIVYQGDEGGNDWRTPVRTMVASVRTIGLPAASKEKVAIAASSYLCQGDLY